jgi:ABC-type phosphate transport system ATPase subunit
LVTHDLEQARRLSEWLIRIEAGRAVDQGPTDALLAGRAR